MKRHVSTALLCVVVAISTGCIKEGSSASRWLGHPNSYHILNERVELTVKGEAFEPSGQANLVGIDAAVSAALEFIESEIRKEAGRHQQSWSASTFFSSDKMPEHLLLTATRHTGDRKDDDFDTKIEIELTRVEDTRVWKACIRRVTYARSKAKILHGTNKLNLGLTMAVQGMWTTASGELLFKQNLMLGGAYALAGIKIPEEESNMIVHEYADDAPEIGNVFFPDVDGVTYEYRLSVLETDATKVGELLTKGADLLKENRDNISGIYVK